MRKTTTNLDFIFLKKRTSTFVLPITSVFLQTTATSKRCQPMPRCSMTVTTSMLTVQRVAQITAVSHLVAQTKEHLSGRAREMQLVISKWRPIEATSNRCESFERCFTKVTVSRRTGKQQLYTIKLTLIRVTSTVFAGTQQCF